MWQHIISQCRPGMVMVMTGDEAKDVILGADGLVSSMQVGDAIFLSATIKPREAREIGAIMAGTGIHFIDTPVSGGYPGAPTGPGMYCIPDTWMH